MKKQLKKLLILIISIFTIPIIAKADMGAPESYQYEVIISNPKGAPVYDWDGKATGKVVPFDTKITVGYEYTINGELYVDLYYDGTESDELTIDGVIKASDTKLFTTEVDFSKLYENEEKEQFYAIANTDMYKGPSTVYGKVENVKIPAGTTINYEYEVGEDFSQWIYTDYNGTKGWVFTYAMEDMSPYTIKCTVVLVEKGKIMIIGDQDVYNHAGEVVGKAKDLEEYEYIYTRQTYPKVPEYYIKNDKIEGWVSISYFMGYAEGGAHYNPGSYLVIDKNGIELYEDYKQTKKVKNLTIPYGTEYNQYYCVGAEIVEKDEFDETNIIGSCQVSYNGKKYWVNEEEEGIIYTSDITIKTTEEQTMYKYNDTTETLNITIPANTTLTTKWEYLENFDSPITWYYVEYEGTKGWISIDSSENEAIVEEEELVPEEDEEETPVEDEETEENEEKTLTPKQTAYIAIGTAALLAVGALFTILLINKNKKNKKENEEKIVEEATRVVEETKEPKETDNETK